MTGKVNTPTDVLCQKSFVEGGKDTYTGYLKHYSYNQTKRGGDRTTLYLESLLKFQGGES